MKNRSHTYDINRPRFRHGHKYSKYKKCLSIIFICIKQHLSNIWSSIHEKVKQHWGWVEKSVDYKRIACSSKLNFTRISHCQNRRDIKYCTFLWQTVGLFTCESVRHTLERHCVIMSFSLTVSLIANDVVTISYNKHPFNLFQYRNG